MKVHCRAILGDLFLSSIVTSKDLSEESDVGLFEIDGDEEGCIDGVTDGS